MTKNVLLEQVRVRISLPRIKNSQFLSFSLPFLFCFVFLTVTTAGSEHPPFSFIYNTKKETQKIVPDLILQLCGEEEMDIQIYLCYHTFKNV